MEAPVNILLACERLLVAASSFSKIKLVLPGCERAKRARVRGCSRSRRRCSKIEGEAPVVEVRMRLLPF